MGNLTSLASGWCPFCGQNHKIVPLPKIIDFRDADNIPIKGLPQLYMVVTCGKRGMFYVPMTWIEVMEAQNVLESQKMALIKAQEKKVGMRYANL